MMTGSILAGGHVRRVACVALVAAAFAVPMAAPAAAQQAEPPRQPATAQLDFLFGALKVAPDTESAKHVEARIAALWMRTPSDTAALLMSRARQALEADNSDVALKLLDAIVKLRPDYVEAWNKRATLYYLRNDYARALADIREVLAREPRHFGALAGLGMIMRDIGDDRKALAAFRQALALHPHLGNIPDLVKSLTEQVEGRDI